MKMKRSIIYLCLLLLTAMFLIVACKKEKVKDHSFLYAFFKADRLSISAGDTIKFEDLSLGNPVSWKWTFEGGNPSSSIEQNPVVIYDHEGTYNVSLEISDGSSSSLKELENYIAVVEKDYLKQYLTVYFPFDNLIEDIGPDSVGAKVLGNVLFNGIDRHSNKNGAAVFDGNSLIIVPDNAAFNFGMSDFTVSCWIKTGQQKKMMIWQESGAKGGGDHQTWLRLGDNTTDRQIRFNTEDSGGSNIINSATGISDNAWHQVVCVREGTTTRLYVDGVKKGELTKSTVKDVSSEQDFKIGAQEGPLGSYSNYFIGLLDDFKVFSKALNDQDIMYLYQREK
ncbi:MAG: PKD domain-containing protein [Acidobacterium ailaaui]|nr:PKD domain-containing protein [Pseudacidobacterium ailaaui]